MKTPLPFAPPDRRKHSSAGWTLVEMMVALLCGMIIVASLMAITVFASRSYLAIANYRDLDKNSRNALDVMSRDIRNMSPNPFIFSQMLGRQGNLRRSSIHAGFVRQLIDDTLSLKNRIR